MSYKIKRFSNIDSAENKPGKILDTVSGVQGVAALGSLGYGAFKLGQVGKSVYEGTKEKKSTLGKLLEAKKRAKKTLEKSSQSFKTLDTFTQIIDEKEKNAKEKITKGEKGLQDFKEKVRKIADGEGTVDSKTYDELKKEKESLKKGIRRQEGVIKGVRKQRELIKDAKNLKKAKIAAGVALATGAVSLGTSAISKHKKKKELQKKFSLESGEPNNKGSLGRELLAKARSGSIKGSIAGGSLGLTVGGTLGLAFRDLRLTGLISLAGLSAGTLVGILSKMSEVIGAKRRKNQAKGVGMNEVLDFLEDSIAVENNKGYGIKGRNLISRYISLDDNPSKFDLSIALKDGIGIMSVKKAVAGNVEAELEKMIKNNRLANYNSKSLKDGYLVELEVPSIKAIANFIYNIAYSHHLRINVITQKT